jgi:hypothetical protein
LAKLRRDANHVGTHQRAKPKICTNRSRGFAKANGTPHGQADVPTSRRSQVWAASIPAIRQRRVCSHWMSKPQAQGIGQSAASTEKVQRLPALLVGHQRGPGRGNGANRRRRKVIEKSLKRGIDQAPRSRPAMTGRGPPGRASVPCSCAPVPRSGRGASGKPINFGSTASMATPLGPSTW